MDADAAWEEGDDVDDDGVDDEDDSVHVNDDEDDDDFGMRFTVIGRSDGQVHVVSEGGGEVFVHPAVDAEVWAAVCDRAPAGWEIVEVPAGKLSEPSVWDESRSGDDKVDDEYAAHVAQRRFAEMQYDIFHSFVEAGFERAEAMRLLVKLMTSDLDPGDDD